MFDTEYRMLGAGAQRWSREMIWGARWEGGSGLGTHVHQWLIHVNVWQNQYSIVKKNKIKIKIKKSIYWMYLLYTVLCSCVLCLVAQWCPTLCDPMDCSPPGSSLHGIFQTRILKGYPFLSPEVLLTQGSNSGLMHCRWILYLLNHQRSWVGSNFG